MPRAANSQVPQTQEEPKKTKTHRQQIGTERLKLLGSGGGNRKNREDSERTGRMQEGAGVSAGGRVQRRQHRNAQKVGQHGGGWVKEPAAVRYVIQFESLNPADPGITYVFAFIWPVPLTKEHFFVS